MGIEISVTEFKAKCLDLIDKLSRHEFDSIELTKRGQPIAVVLATQPPKSKTLEEAMAELRAWQASMKDNIWINPDFDLTQPTSDLDDCEAYHGRVFPNDG